MLNAQTAHCQGYPQGSCTWSGYTEYTMFQYFQWMADVVSNKIIHHAQAYPHSEHHVYYHFVPMEPGAPPNYRASRTSHSLFLAPNWSNSSPVGSRPDLTPARLETQCTSRTPVGHPQGTVSYKPPPPAYNSDQIERAGSQNQNLYHQALHTQVHADPIRPGRVFTPKEFIQELQRLLIQRKGNQHLVGRFHIQGEEIPVSVWRPDQSGPFLVQHYLPNGQEDAITVAHIVSGGRIMWCPLPKSERL